MLHCRLALGQQPTVQHEVSDKPDTDINAGILHAVRKGCTAGALPIVWLITPPAYKKMTLKQANRASHQREAADLAVNCEKVAIAEPAAPALGAAGLFLTRWPIAFLAGAFKFGSERQAPGSLQRLRKAPVIASSGLVLVKRHQSGRDLRDHYQCFPQV